MLARQTDGQINGRNAKYTNVKGQRSAFHCHSVKCIYDAKRFIFSTCIIQSARTSKLSALHFEKSDRGDSLRKVDCGRPISNRPRRLKYTRNVCYTDKLISVFFLFFSQSFSTSACLCLFEGPSGASQTSPNLPRHPSGVLKTSRVTGALRAPGRAPFGRPFRSAPPRPAGFAGADFTPLSDNI